LALAVPLSRFTPRIGGGSAFYVRHHGARHENPKIEGIRNCRSRCSYSCQRVPAGFHTGLVWGRNVLFALRFGWDISVFQPKREATGRGDWKHRLFRARGPCDLFCRIVRVTFGVMTMMPNQSPEPTAVGAVSSAVAVHVTSLRWLSFFR